MSRADPVIGIYWERAVWNRARSAYVADLDLDPDSPDAFVGWLDRAIERHTRRSPTERAELAEAVAVAPAPAGNNFNKAHHLRQTTIAAMEDAIVDDRQQLGRMVGRSGFVREAALAAAARTQRAYGRPLPPPPARLPNRPARRTRRS